MRKQGQQAKQRLFHFSPPHCLIGLSGNVAVNALLLALPGKATPLYLDITSFTYGGPGTDCRNRLFDGYYVGSQGPAWHEETS